MFGGGCLLQGRVLAIFDINSGANRDQAITGENLGSNSPSKITKSWVVKKILEAKDRSIYLKNIMEEVEFQRISKENFPQAEIEEIPENFAPVDKPDKKETTPGPLSAAPHPE